MFSPMRCPNSLTVAILALLTPTVLSQHGPTLYTGAALLTLARSVLYNLAVQLD